MWTMSLEGRHEETGFLQEETSSSGTGERRDFVYTEGSFSTFEFCVIYMN